MCKITSVSAELDHDQVSSASGSPNVEVLSRMYNRPLKHFNMQSIFKINAVQV